jgi:hypothetical protein
MTARKGKSVMDVITFDTEGTVVYRDHADHSFKVGVGGVKSIATTLLSPPRTGSAPFVTNICGSFKCPFYKQGREGILFRNNGFGGHHVMHHIDGLLQVTYINIRSQSSRPPCPLNLHIHKKLNPINSKMASQ